MNFYKVEAGHYRAYAPDHNIATIRKDGREWKLEIVDWQTNDTIHSFKATKEYLCEQEANRFYGQGAYADHET